MQDADIQPDGSAELELTQQHLDTLAHMNGVMQWLSPNADREYIRENARHMKALYALMMVTTVGDQLDERDARRDGKLETSVTTVGDHTRVNPGTEYVFKASVRGDPFMSWDSYFEELSRSIQAAGDRR